MNIKRVAFEHTMNVIALSASLYLTADNFDHTELQTIIMFSIFALATHLYVCPLWSKHKYKRRKGE